MSYDLDVLIPTYNRTAALALTLAGLAAQSFRGFRVVVSDQSEEQNAASCAEVKAVSNILHLHGNPVEIHKHLPRRGLAEHRQFLLEQARAPYVLFIDDDVLLEQFSLEVMLKVILEEGCGFVGNAVIGLSYVDDIRPHEQAIELWEGPVEPELVRPGSREWERYRLHNAANLYHVQERLRAFPEKPIRYKVAWVGGCVLYDTLKLRQAGGFNFWNQLPAEHAGEDVLAQLRVMKAYGGCGIMPSGAYHLELPTTIPVRDINAPQVLELDLVEAYICHANTPTGKENENDGC
jgi:glycosyltransferase involved in cell wall biosynthesis